MFPRPHRRFAGPDTLPSDIFLSPKDDPHVRTSVGIYKSIHYYLYIYIDKSGPKKANTCSLLSTVI